MGMGDKQMDNLPFQLDISCSLELLQDDATAKPIKELSKLFSTKPQITIEEQAGISGLVVTFFLGFVHGMGQEAGREFWPSFKQWLLELCKVIKGKELRWQNGMKVEYFGKELVIHIFIETCEFHVTELIKLLKSQCNDVLDKYEFSIKMKVVYLAYIEGSWVISQALDDEYRPIKMKSK